MNLTRLLNSLTQTSISFESRFDLDRSIRKRDASSMDRRFQTVSSFIAEFLDLFQLRHILCIRSFPLLFRFHWLGLFLHLFWCHAIHWLHLWYFCNCDIRFYRYRRILLDLYSERSPRFWRSTPLSI